MKPDPVKMDAEPERRPATAYEVAELAGVSQSAVSRVFTPGASVSAAMREKVQDAAQQLGYRPNLVARSLITRRSSLIGVAVPGTANPFYQAALDALSTSFARIGYRVLLFTSDPLAGSDPILEEVLRYRVDALVLISTSLSSHFADECLQQGLPVVMLNRKTDGDSVPSVAGDNRRGAKELAAFLLAGKHRRFAYVAGLEHSSTNRDREAGFLEGLAERKIRHVERVVGNYSAGDTELVVRKLLSSTTPPDAIFCANDYMALVAINLARAEFQLNVGTDVSIVGFDDIEMARWPIFGLTTYSQPVKVMVQRVVQVVQRQLSAAVVPAVQHIVDGELIVRGSARVPQTGVVRSADQWTWHSRKHRGISR
ncbi:LacI family DNA-binding transcriptional regulator [Paraburkholderia acidicola]|uniref:LacI family DNA-binding transcriptional regulator n=1 Tax=Paraburkholderia acidicola TaxID=1912599 RepID=A0ABV1LW39_9BURK